MDNKKLGARLKQARLNCGLEQKDIAAELDVSRPVIAQMEAGNRTISAVEIAQLSGVLRQPLAYFLEVEQKQEAFYRRKSGGVSAVEIHALVQQLIESHKPNAPSAPPLVASYDLPLPSTKSEAHAQGSAVANSERRRLNLGLAPLASVSMLIEFQRIPVAFVKFPHDDISGVFVSHEESGMLLLVNGSHGPARTRFSLSHEYGHVVMDRKQRFGISERTNSRDLVETRANAFAAAFLMPAEGVKQALDTLGKGRLVVDEKVVYDGKSARRISNRADAEDVRIRPEDVLRLSMYFGASYQAVAYQLSTLNHISRTECAKLLAQEAKDSDHHKAEMKTVHGFQWQT